MKLGVFLDQRAGLVAVQPRHHDIDEDEIRLVVRDLGQGVEPVIGQYYGAARLQQENLGAATNRVAVVDHHDFHALQRGCVLHFPAPGLTDKSNTYAHRFHAALAEFATDVSKCLEHNPCQKGQSSDF